MRSMCKKHNLGSRFRQRSVRGGVIWLAFTLVVGFVLVERGVAARFGIFLAAPLALGTYSLLAGSFGVCFYNSMFGRRMADHGAEVVPDETLRKRFVRRGLTLAGLSCTLAGVATAVFVASV